MNDEKIMKLDSIDLKALPGSLGYRMPAEWSEQERVWFSWPLSTHIWPGQREAIETAFAALIAAASRFQPVAINASAEGHGRIREALNKARADLSVISIFDHPTNDVWCRDHGPVFVRHPDSGQLAVTNWGFNAWGGKFSPWDLDNEVPVRIAETLGLPCHDLPLILEGGAIEVDGEGTLITTDSVLLNPNRNPGWTRADYEIILQAALGANRVVWLRDGVANDDTDGHIDNIARFFAPDSVLVVTDPAQPVLVENQAVLESAFANVVPLSLPETSGPPYSYANFLILNDGVLLPVFGQARNDDRAAGILKECFPGRRVVPFDCRLFLEEGGAIHCLSQQQPR